MTRVYCLILILIRDIYTYTELLSKNIYDNHHVQLLNIFFLVALVLSSGLNTKKLFFAP